MAKFRCKASGNIVEFTYEVDIKSTRRNKGYEEVIEVIEEASQDVKVEAPKKAGRPPKAQTVTTTEE
jgi:hypothetical protein